MACFSHFQPFRFFRLYNENRLLREFEGWSMVENNQQRKLAAIMFTDIVGYSQMMEHDESGTLSFLQFHNALVRMEIEDCQGQVIKTVGDAFLAEFSSAVNAVKCAISIQKRFLEHSKSSGEP